MWLFAQRVRLIFVLLLILLVLLAPWRWSLVIGLVGLVAYSRFYELVAPALLFDLVYGWPRTTPAAWWWPPPVSLLVLLAVFVLARLRRYLNF